jgi:hypothetical protein
MQVRIGHPMSRMKIFSSNIKTNQSLDENDDGEFKLFHWKRHMGELALRV